MDKVSENPNGKDTIPKSNNFKKLTGEALLVALILGITDGANAEVLTGTTSQKQAIELLKSQGKLLPNVPTDYLHYGIRYPSGNFVYNVYPYADHRQRYKADNLKNVDGKDLTIQNDIDSCNFLNETVYKNNLHKIVPTIIDTEIDTARGATNEYERVDWTNSKDFSGAGLIVDGGKSTHMNAMADVLIAKKDNFTEEDYTKGLERRTAREDVGVWPGKARLYVNVPSVGGNDETPKALESVYDEAKLNPDKKYIVSYSWSGGDPVANEGFTKLGTLDNVMIFVARTTKAHENINDNYTANPATIEVGYLQVPDMVVTNTETQKLSFAGEQKDRVVPMGNPSTGKMKGDGFCVLGEWSTSQATAYMTGVVANIRAQNPNKTKDDIMRMLKESVYKPSEYEYDENGRNEYVGYGIVQPGLIMKENIFPEIKGKKSPQDGKYYFTVDFPNYYTIEGEGVQKDANGYYVDLSSMNSGTYNYTFIGKCYYDGEGTGGKWEGTYDFPIVRTMEVDTGTYVNNVRELTDVKVYPNPVQDILNIQIGSDIRELNVKIYNATGQLYTASNLNLNNNQIDLSSLKPGIYFVTMVDEKGRKKTEKIVKKQ